MRSAESQYFEVVSTEWQQHMDARYPEYTRSMLDKGQQSSLAKIIGEVGGDTGKLNAWLFSNWRLFTMRVENRGGGSSDNSPRIPSLTFIWHNLGVALELANERRVLADDDAQDAPPAAQGRLRA